MSRLGEEVRAWRLSQGLTQAQAARMLGVSISTIQSLETGRRKVVQQGDLDTLADAMHLDGRQIRGLLPNPGFAGRWIPIQ